MPKFKDIPVEMSIAILMATHLESQRPEEISIKNEIIDQHKKSIADKYKAS